MTLCLCETIGLAQEFTQRRHLRDDIPQDLGEAVVHFSGDPLALLVYRQTHQATMEPGICDRERSLYREPLQPRAIMLIEWLTILAIGQIETTEHSLLRADGHPEQAAHGGMTLGIAPRPGIPIEILDIDGTIVPQYCLQNAVLSHRALFAAGGSRITRGEERTLALIIQHDQKAITRAGQPTSFVDHSLQHESEIEISGDRHASFVQGSQFRMLHEEAAVECTDRAEDPIGEDD